MNACFVRGLSITPCSVCSTQPVCKRTKPSVQGFSPPTGTRGSGVNDVLQVIFSVELKWCVANAPHRVSFWCEGSQTQSIGGLYLSVVAHALKVDISQSIKHLARHVDRKCGLTVAADLLCDRVTEAPFAGLAQGVYHFTLSDTSPPRVKSFLPDNDARQVDPNSVVKFTFDEAIVLGPSTLFLTFVTMDTDQYGAASSEVSSKLYSLQIPHVSSRGNNTLQFDMKGKTKPGWLYSIALPAGAVVDLSGNKFVGMSGGMYTFRTAPASFRSSIGGGNTNSTGFIVALSLGLVFGGCCVAGLVWKFQGACYISQAHKPKARQVGPVPVPKQTQAQVEAVSRSGQPVQAVGFHGQPTTNSGLPRTTPPAPASDSKESSGQSKESSRANGGGWSRAGSPAPKAEYIYPDPKPAERYPERPAGMSDQRAARPPAGRNSAETRSGSNGPSSKPDFPRASSKTDSTPKTATAPVIESTNPAARKIEKKMRDAMNEPIAVRKKMIKDLMFEHHPDKNAGSDEAKEVFQFINGARAWFVHDA